MKFAMNQLNEKTEAVIENLFPGAGRETVRGILIEECTSKLPLARPDGYERIHLAVLKISAGDVNKFLEAGN